MDSCRLFKLKFYISSKTNFKENLGQDIFTFNSVFIYSFPFGRNLFDFEMILHSPRKIVVEGKVTQSYKRIIQIFKSPSNIHHLISLSNENEPK